MSDKPTKLPKNEETVLRFLYDAKDAVGSPSTNAIAKGTRLSVGEVRRALNGLRERGMVNGPPSLLQAVTEHLKGLDENTTPTTDSFAPAAVLMGSYLAKADEVFLADELDFDPEFVALVGSRLRNAGVWKGDKVSQIRQAKWETDALSFWMDVTIACGDIAVVGGSPENPQYSMTELAEAKVMRMNRDAAP